MLRVPKFINLKLGPSNYQQFREIFLRSGAFEPAPGVYSYEGAGFWEISGVSLVSVYQLLFGVWPLGRALISPWMLLGQPVLRAFKWYVGFVWGKWHWEFPWIWVSKTSMHVWSRKPCKQNLKKFCIDSSYIYIYKLYYEAYRRKLPLQYCRNFHIHGAS